MSEKKYVVPEGMLKAATPVYLNDERLIQSVLEAALRWLAENPIVPTDEQWSKIPFSTLSQFPFVQASFAEWQRRMFLAPEPEIPEAVKDLLWERVGFAGFTNDRESYNDAILEAFRRGRISHDEK